MSIYNICFVGLYKGQYIPSSKNQNITLTEFKWIWWMEYAHRTWGRAIGAAVFLPAAYFWLRGRLDKGMKIRVAVYCTLVAAQVTAYLD